MNTEHRRIGAIHDEFARDGYREALEEVAYAPTHQVPALLAALNIKQDELEILDLGCGPGNLKDITSFSYYRGVDVSPEMLRQAGENGYQELTEGDMMLFLCNQPDKSVDGIFALSCTYFLPPEELQQFMQEIDRVARQFWLVTFDGITEKVSKVYREEMNIPTYNHLGSWAGEATYRETVPGWHSRRTKEYIPMEFVATIYPSAMHAESPKPLSGQGRPE